MSETRANDDDPQHPLSSPEHAAETSDTTTDAQTPDATSSRKRARSRPWLLAGLLAALIGLLVVQPDLREDAGETARTAVMDGLNISPRAIYDFRLRVSGLADSALGRRWREAVARAGEDPMRIESRYATQAGFDPDTIEAHVYETRLDRGERLDIRLSRRDDSGDRLYASLERRDADDERGEAAWSTVAELRLDGRTERVVADRDSAYRLVLQPELAGRAAYAMAFAVGGSLSFPVEGAGGRDIGSGFGAPRDGGARQHHGVDIFAERGTPVVAVADGRVRTGTGGIGGNHVWLSSGMLGIGGARYYYAHLDGFNVESGDSVASGDVLGYVGNTGNARTTPPHLHFGIYTNFGPVDPAPFLRPAPRLPAEPAGSG